MGKLKWILQLEGLALFIAATAIYGHSNQSWSFYALLFFLPDLCFLTYLGGSKIGAVFYNVLHSTIGPITLFAATVIFSVNPIFHAVALIWAAHVGFDRMLGYGLKHFSGFKSTHLGEIGRG